MRYWPVKPQALGIWEFTKIGRKPQFVFKRDQADGVHPQVVARDFQYQRLVIRSARQIKIRHRAGADLFFDLQAVHYCAWRVFTKLHSVDGCVHSL